MFNNDIDIKENMIPLCPNYHRKLHNAQNNIVKDLLIKMYSGIDKKAWIKRGIFVDMCCGGASVGLNANAKYGLKNKNIKLVQSDFRVIKELDLRKDDFVYIDPPYLITNAVYNWSGSKWDEVKETELLLVLSYLNEKGIRFALSNVLRKGANVNKILLSWIKKNKFDINYMNYHSSSYNKKDRATPEEEVLITNYSV
ncbi:hypothetical protein AGMMS5026_04890 [Endomicrobiia bacterium]|uniref:DNA adenine methylase n=1 Tax=Endomicrobium trichonymphae TaxID=1408204 RepID=UPI00221B8A90|nr:hypothetical protein AGMMS49523_00220 [Endomicrobiia bacterium]GMO54731.1 MAG: hypothetical protein Ta2C_08370 [Candidatus Endomicrobium trichonymphae]GHT11229.1 hypothetical protein AGMMS49571_01220 [Endomicrobiia bacterium]GHT19599.1 hypothetical protein AGMMS49929_03710 [Endomicrobiia bacterium]GHT25673.1 hypothetical protein AGMMS49995_00220 [Endomicrobiia bacterium]